MRLLIFVAIVAGVLLIFGATYAISAAVNKRKRPKYKTVAPDDDPKFLRDLAERLKNEPNPGEAKPAADAGDNSAGDAEGGDEQDSNEGEPGER